MFSNDLILKILDYLDKNLYKKITIDELSNLFHYNKDYIMRVFKKETQFTIMDYLNRKRIFLSLNGLKEKHSILMVALNHGFYSQEYYCEVFHKIMGVSPSSYQLFFNHSQLLTEEEIFTIQNNLSSLFFCFHKIDTYKRNIPSKNPIKVLTIFKEKTP